MKDVWIESWYAVSDEKIRRALEDELRKEVGPRHSLWKQRVQLLARRDDQDDAVFLLDDGRIAEVHLTWIGKVEPDPRPKTSIFTNMDHWRAARMKDDES